MSFTSTIIGTAERVPLPDIIIRAAIHRLCSRTALRLATGNAESDARFAEAMAARAIAEHADAANAQHYEVPAAFFGRVLGPNRKYSSCFYKEPASTLQEAEEEALRQTVEHADLAEGQSILELGCGWGSLSLWMARQFPHALITAVSNSKSQREYIEEEARSRRLTNLRVITQDMNVFAPDARFDRIVSVEMFEHLRNWPEAFRRVRGWLRDDGRFFMHVFVHRLTPYAFVERDAADWMSRHFFAGGMMPSDDLALRFQDDLQLVSRWRWDGTHYERTSNAWLANMDERRAAIWPVLEQTYGADQAALWWVRWRIFFMSCAELFGYDRGQQWWVSHYLFKPRA